MSFWDVIWFIVVSFAFIAYLMVMFWIITDLFRDKNSSGWAKALWVVLLIFLPLLTSIVYLIAKGPGMAERQSSAISDARKQQDSYIQEVAGRTSPVEQIARAKELVDSGAINQQEFESIKAKALAS